MTDALQGFLSLFSIKNFPKVVDALQLHLSSPEEPPGDRLLVILYLYLYLFHDNSQMTNMKNTAGEFASAPVQS